MIFKVIMKYLDFLHGNRSAYVTFNKQLFIAELAGFFGGIAVAEILNLIVADEISISIWSGVADYVGSILGFLAICYFDADIAAYSNKSQTERFRMTMRYAISLWPSVLAADVVFIIIRPYIHYIFLLSGFEAGVAAVISHFLAFGAFNAVAILSKSILDYIKSVDNGIKKI